MDYNECCISKFQDLGTSDVDGDSLPLSVAKEAIMEILVMRSGTSYQLG